MDLCFDKNEKFILKNSYFQQKLKGFKISIKISIILK